MDNNRNNDNKQNNYTQQQLKEIWIHRVILFIMFYLTLSLSAMKALLQYYPVFGQVVCIALAGLMSYFMSFIVYRWKNESGWWVYGIVFFIILLMLSRYQF